MQIVISCPVAAPVHQIRGMAKNTRMTVPATDDTKQRVAALGEAIGTAEGSLAHQAMIIGLDLMESMYLRRPLPELFTVAVQPMAPEAPSRGAVDEPFPTDRTRETIARLAARAKALGFRIVDTTKTPAAASTPAADAAAVAQLAAPTPTPAVPGNEPAPRNVAALVAPQPAQQPAPAQAPHVPDSRPVDPEPTQAAAPAPSPEQAEQQAIRARLEQLLEDGVPVEEAYERAKAEVRGTPAPDLAPPPEQGGNGAMEVSDPMKCIHGIRWDAAEPCRPCSAEGF